MEGNVGGLQGAQSKGLTKAGEWNRFKLTVQGARAELEINGKPDYRIQKFDEWTKRYKDMYLLDNQMQLDVCLEDPEYTKWLDPEGVPCYRKYD